MGFFSGLFGKPKVDHSTAQNLGLQAIRAIGRMLTDAEQGALIEAVNVFYSKTKMWPAGNKSIQEIENYFILLAKYLGLYFYDNFRQKFNKEDLIRLSQGTILMELFSTLNSQKANPNSETAMRLSKIIINQELATQSSYIIAMDSIPFLESERIKVNKIVRLLETDRAIDAWRIMYEA